MAEFGNLKQEIRARKNTLRTLNYEHVTKLDVLMYLMKTTENPRFQFMNDTAKTLEVLEANENIELSVLEPDGNVHIYLYQKKGKVEI